MLPDNCDLVEPLYPRSISSLAVPRPLDLALTLKDAMTSPSSSPISPGCVPSVTLDRADPAML
jgi:hypothetical protein